MTSVPIFGRLSSQTWKSVYLCSRYFRVDIFCLSGPVSWKVVLVVSLILDGFDYSEKIVRGLGCVLKKICWSDLWNLKWLDSQQVTEKRLTSHHFTWSKFPSDSANTQGGLTSHVLQADLTPSHDLQTFLFFRIARERCISLMCIYNSA